VKQEVEEKERDIQDYAQRESDLQKENTELVRMHEAADRSLIMMKAKEYDKVDVLRKIAEFESKAKYLQVDNESLVKERNNLDLANVELSH